MKLPADTPKYITDQVGAQTSKWLTRRIKVLAEHRLSFDFYVGSVPRWPWYRRAWYRYVQTPLHWLRHSVCCGGHGDDY